MAQHYVISVAKAATLADKQRGMAWQTTLPLWWTAIEPTGGALLTICRPSSQGCLATTTRAV